MTTRRKLLLGTTGMLTIARTVRAQVQPFPSRTIKIVVPASPGTTSDAVARFLSEPLSKRLNVPVIVENRAGAGALLGYSAVVKAAPDGHTLLVASQPRFMLPLFSPENAKFDSIQDFTSISRIARTSLVVAVPADSRHRTLADLVQAMQDHPSDLTYASQGVGSSAHLCSVLLNAATGTSARHISYKETSSGVLDVVSGRIDFTCQGSGSALSQILNGKLRALAVTGPRRWEALPDVPTGAQAGVERFRIFTGLDIIGPAGIPKPVATRLSDAILAVTRTQEFKRFCAKHAYSVDLLAHEELTRLVPAEAAEWKRLYALANQTNMR